MFRNQRGWPRAAIDGGVIDQEARRYVFKVKSNNLATILISVLLHRPPARHIPFEAHDGFVLTLCLQLCHALLQVHTLDSSDLIQCMLCIRLASPNRKERFLMVHF